jgi:hypothetical protein
MGAETQQGCDATPAKARAGLSKGIIWLAGGPVRAATASTPHYRPSYRKKAAFDAWAPMTAWLKKAGALG